MTRGLPAGLPAAPRASARHRLAPWVLGFLAYWVAYAGAYLLARPEVGWAAALRGAAFTIWPEAVLAPVVYALARRVPWDVSRGRLAALHLAGGFLFVMLSLGGTVAAFAVEVRVTTGAWTWPTPAGILVWRAVMTLLVYFAISSIGHATAFAQKVRAEADRAARAETLRAEARLAALRAQLNPHFILNLLHSLMGMVLRDPETASSALERLGGLMRHALHLQRRDRDEVPLRDELAFVEDYLALERLRLGDRLQVEMKTDADALDSAVPAFVLQPLVENAIRYAVAPRAAGGKLAVTIRSEDGTLRLRVEDDGPGAGAAAPREEGLGLSLIEERLAALYGKAAWLRAGPAPAGGFAAEVAIPRHGAQREEET